MRVTVFGLGYVGVVTSACLTDDGHHVVGVDVNADKVASLADGLPPVIEPGVDRLLGAAADGGRLEATTEAAVALREADVALVCVGTPSDRNGAVDLEAVRKVVRSIADVLADSGREIPVLLRSTVPPGTTDGIIHDLRQEGLDAPVAFVPEFLREGSAVADFRDPPYTIIGTRDEAAEEVARELFSNVKGPVHVVDPATAELVKYGANAWHATKIAFANEIGRLGRHFAVDARDVMEVLVQDTKLNISAAYLRPGFAYGGSCLPKDVAALQAVARESHLQLPLLQAVSASNDRHVDLAAELVLHDRPRRVAIYGLAFKPGTDDLRNSPAVRLAKRLLGEGVRLRVFDPWVNTARLTGANLAYVREHLPHFEELLDDDVEAAVADADTVVLTHSTGEARRVVDGLPEGVRVIDVAGALGDRRTGDGYAGIGW